MLGNVGLLFLVRVWRVSIADLDETALAVLALVVTVVRWRKRCEFCELTDLLDDWDLLNRITGGFHDRSICTKATTSFPRGHAD